MTVRKRAVRQRVWTDDSVRGRNIGEGMRDVEAAIGAQSVPTRLIVLNNIVYQPPIVVPMADRPAGVITVHTERFNGAVQFTSAFVDFKWADGELRMTVNGLSLGERYASLKFLVIG